LGEASGQAGVIAQFKGVCGMGREGVFKHLDHGGDFRGVVCVRAGSAPVGVGAVGQDGAALFRAEMGVFEMDVAPAGLSTAGGRPIGVVEMSGESPVGWDEFTGV